MPYTQVISWSATGKHCDKANLLYRQIRILCTSLSSEGIFQTGPDFLTIIRTFEVFQYAREILLYKLRSMGYPGALEIPALGQGVTADFYLTPLRGCY